MRLMDQCFAAADKFLDIQTVSGSKAVIVRMRGVPAMDVTALRSLRNIHAVCKDMALL